MTTLSAVQVSVALPALLLIGLTFVVWVLLYVERLTEMRREGIRPQDVATRTEARAVLKRTRAADNFQNLLEVPVLFYALTAIVLLLDLRSAPFAPLAMTYVGLRVLHSAIHITYNRVMHRFTVHFVSTLVLIVMWFDVLRQVLAAWSNGDV
jgi:hypothetical protein